MEIPSAGSVFGYSLGKGAREEPLGYAKDLRPTLSAKVVKFFRHKQGGRQLKIFKQTPLSMSYLAVQSPIRFWGKSRKRHEVLSQSHEEVGQGNDEESPKECDEVILPSRPSEVTEDLRSESTPGHEADHKKDVG